MPPARACEGGRRSMPNICGHDAHCPAGSARTDHPARSGVDGATLARMMPVTGQPAGRALRAPSTTVLVMAWRQVQRCPVMVPLMGSRPPAGTIFSATAARASRSGTCRSCPLSRSPRGSAATLPSSLVATSATPSTLATSLPSSAGCSARIGEERHARRPARLHPQPRQERPGLAHRTASLSAAPPDIMFAPPGYVWRRLPIIVWSHHRLLGNGPLAVPSPGRGGGRGVRTVRTVRGRRVPSRASSGPGHRVRRRARWRHDAARRTARQTGRAYRGRLCAGGWRSGLTGHCGVSQRLASTSARGTASKPVASPTAALTRWPAWVLTPRDRLRSSVQARRQPWPASATA